MPLTLSAPTSENTHLCHLSPSVTIIIQANMQEIQISSTDRDSPRPASREESVAGEAERAGATEAGRLEGGVPLILGLTTAGEPGPRSIRLSSVASLRTCKGTKIIHQ